MTPTEIEEAARSACNAIGDTFLSSIDILKGIYQAEILLAREGVTIENSYTTSTVASQQEYAYPTNAIGIKRITYDGAKLTPIDFRIDDTLTLNTSSTSTGTPEYYYIWDRVIFLRPIPSAVGTLKIFTYDMPSVVTTTSTLDVPVEFHMDIVDYLCAQYYAKDKDLEQASFYMDRWQKHLESAKKWAQRKKRGDGMAFVKNEDTSAIGLVGII